MERSQRFIKHNLQYFMLRLSTKEDVAKVSALWTKVASIISIGTEKADGVGIFFKSHIEVIKYREPGRILLIDCFHRNIKLRVINLYTPPDNKAKVRIFRKLHELLMVKYFIFVVCGNFNAYRDGKDRIPQQSIEMTKEKRAQMSEECNMKDVFRVKVDFTRFDKNIKQ